MSDQEVEFDNSIRVERIRVMAEDVFVAQAARTSTAADLDTDKPIKGLIGALMRDRHGSPFEHGMFTFRVNAPIFLFREWQRHRIGWSYNEQSGRYTQFEPRFYVPGPGRPLVQVGKAIDYDLRDGTFGQRTCAVRSTMEVCEAAWAQYQDMLLHGVAKEVARGVLPVTTYSTMYATCNPRSLMHFLSLRTRDDTARYPSKPQWEIDQAARLCEEVFAVAMPITYEAWDANGRVAP